MRKPLRLSVVVINLIFLIILAAIWIAFAPTLIGGRASYVVVNGNSMEPGFHRGDLVIVQAASTYNVGDIVIYRDAKLNAYVIHRIIAIEQDRYIFKGDNNSWIDIYRPTRAELIGKLWIHMPKLGKAMEWLRLPINLGLTTGLLGGILMASTMIRSNQHGKGRNRSSGNFGGMLEGGLYLFGFFTLVFFALGIFAFVRPLTRTADKIQYQQESVFSYSATGTPVIYDTEVVRSGEPVFPRLTCFLNIAFTYNLLGDSLQGVAGSHQLIARVMDEQSGWQRTIPMDQRTTFTGNSFSTMSTLDLCQIIALVNTLKQETGLRANSYTLEIITPVVMTASAEGNQIADSFEPKLVFRFDEVHFYLSTPAGQDDPLHLSKQSSANNSNLEANTLSVLGWEPAILTLRGIALLGLVLSLSGLLIVSIRIFMTARQDQEAFIRLRYGGLLVNIYERNLEPASMLIDVTTIDELAKLAERHNTVILHMTLNFLHYYMVQCNGITYRYMFSTGKRGVAEIEPPRKQIISYMTDVNGNGMVKVEPVEDELFEYAINKSRNAKAEATDAIILRKIRL
ncbi:MAG: signal peptidase I [Chloroflexi bacterium]|nr:MAG: signal peptidase I [Chloroflexota bacterium]